MKPLGSREKGGGTATHRTGRFPEPRKGGAKDREPAPMKTSRKPGAKHPSPCLPSSERCEKSVLARVGRTLGVAYVYSDPQASSAEENNQHSERPFQRSSTMPPVRRLRTDSGGPSSLRGEAELGRERRPKANKHALTDSAVVMRLTLEGSPTSTNFPDADTPGTHC